MYWLIKLQLAPLLPALFKQVGLKVATFKPCWLLAFCLGLGACGEQYRAPQFSPSELKPGGDATTKHGSDRTYILPGGHLSLTEQLPFWSGLSFFQDPWVIAPSSTTARDGLGPLFNTRSCITCHSKGARGEEALEGTSKPSALLIRLGLTTGNKTAVDPHYGGQIQVRAIAFNHSQLTAPVEPEAKVTLRYRYISGQFSDGEVYQLRQPHYGLTDLAYGELAAGIGLSPRLGSNIYGMGLLDAISDNDLRALEDINDVNGDGISAKYNRVTDTINKQTNVIGRFGFKAKHPSLEQQVAAAFIGDIGITTSHFTDDNCTNIQTACQQAVTLGLHSSTPEADKTVFDYTLAFNQHLGVPPARKLTNKTVMQGRTLFYQLNCQACHQPSYKTRADYPVASLANQTIWPYTDLALHDMGEGLSDNVNEFSASGQEWRTPPLWGIGLQKAILGTERYLHDGRARNLTEAILWHGGEAKASQQHFQQLDKAQRHALISFLKAI